MYTVNGHHPEVGLNSYILTGGDRIIWHYTDDYTKEEGSEKWNTQNDEVKEVTTTGASSSADDHNADYEFRNPAIQLTQRLARTIRRKC